MKARALALSMAVAALAATALTALPASPAMAGFPGKNGKFVFADTRDDPNPPNCGQFLTCSQIYAMNSDGSGQTRLTNDIGDDENPAWSADGARIAFESDRDDPKVSTCGGANQQFTCNYDIYVMDASGAGQTNLTHNGKVNDQYAAWSPDGSRIAFISNRDDPSPSTCQKTSSCKYDVYSMDQDGNNVTRLTTDGTSYSPAWSPDGSEIVFPSSRIGHREIYVMNADGSGQTQLTSDAKNYAEPDWSPDGTQIVFRDFDTSNFIMDLFVMSADGSNIQQLTHNPSFTFSSWPAWSPDRTKISFSFTGANGTGIYTMSPDGSHVKLIPGTATAYEQNWQPTSVPTALVYPGSGPAGSTVTLTVAHFQAGEKVKLVFTSPTGNVSLGKVTANSFGYASKQVTIPANAATGKHKIKATGLTSGLSASVNFVVT